MITGRFSAYFTNAGRKRASSDLSRQRAPKCLIIDAVHSAIAEELGKYMQVDTHMLPTQEELVKLIPDYDVLIMRVDPKITKEIIDAAANLKVIGVCSVGLNHVDMDACKAKGVQVFNAPGLNANAVAELTFSKMLDLSRHTIPANYDVKVNKTWDKYKFVGRELRGKTLGILGFGRIGQRVGELGRAFKMNIVAYDPYLPAHVFEEQQATSMGIDELLKVSDFVTIHMPLTPETKDLFNAKSLAEMKDDAVVLNMARGGIVNEQDMYEALKAGKIGGYASDVMENELAGGGLTEGAGFDSPLFECENFLVSPHLGAQSTDASRDIGAHIIAKVKDAVHVPVLGNGDIHTAEDAALAASPVGMAAGVALPLSVAAALMGSVPLVVVAAHCIRVIGQSACQQVGHRLVRRPRYAGIELDLRLGQGCSGTAANTAADQRLDAPLTQESSQRPVAAAGGVHHLAGSHRSVFHLIELVVAVDAVIDEGAGGNTGLDGLV